MENISTLVKLREESALPAAEMLKALKTLKAAKYYFFGDGISKCAGEITNSIANAVFLEAAPRASAIGALALLKLKGGDLQDFNKALPFYVRKPDAIINKEEKKSKEFKCRK